MIVLVALAAAQVLVIGFACLLFAGGEPWHEPTLESLPDRAQFVRWPRPTKLNLN